jgi:hypothetical protein
MDSTAMDSVLAGQQWTDWWQWTPMDGSSTAMDGGWQWTAMDGATATQVMAMDLTAMDSEGLLDGDSTGMDDEEWRECDGNGPQSQQWWTTIDGAMATWRWWMTRRQLNGEGRRDGDSMAMDDEEWRERDGNVGAAGGGSNKGQHSIKT